MKRTIAAVVLLTALGILCKLAWKVPRPESPQEATVPTVPASPPVDAAAELRAKYPADRELVDRVLREYHHNALAIERTDGRRGLVLLDRLGLEAVFLYEKYPSDFRRLRDCLTDEAAADLLLHWREYFGLKRADETDRGILIAEIAGLNPLQRRLAARYPNALPLILAEPSGVAELISRFERDPEDLRDALVVLDFISLDQGAADLRSALRTLDEHGPLALEAFRKHGPDGFALVKLYGPVLEALGDALPLEDALIVLRVNSDYVDQMLDRSGPEEVAQHLRHAAAVGLMPAVGGGEQALRLAVEFGELGERALAQAGPDAAEVLYSDYNDASVRTQAVAALAEHGPMALAMLEKYAPEPDFHEVLRRYGARAIPPLAQSDPAPEYLAALRAKERKSFTEIIAQGVLAISRDNGQATIRTIKSDGIERVEALNSTSVEFYQFLPLYDLLHLGRVMSQGYSPTRGEMAWALIDGCFIVADVLSLAALQPEGAVAAQAARAEIKSVGRELGGEATEASARLATRRGAAATAEWLPRWWTVRAAGGTYQLLRRLPEALGRMSVDQIVQVSRPLCAKAGLRLSGFAPMRFLKGGATILRSIPPQRGMKYVAAQALQAGVGVVALHKMEEHLGSRRP